MQTHHNVDAFAYMDVGRRTCRAAAAELRKTPVPGFDRESAPRGLDEMADGLGQMRDSANLLRTDPGGAHAKFRVGMQTYEAGAALLKKAGA